MASWGSYVFELCRINANQGLTAEIDWKALLQIVGGDKLIIPFC